ncbi:hypothetical protein F4801DRAFT_548905 [Xylaria longipes]|nr:hypothetical protein F4801DRAFT_548905 [Xylaria longipes]
MMFRPASIDSQQPTRDVHHVAGLLKELREGKGVLSQGLKDEVRNMHLQVRREKATNETVKQRRDVLHQKLEVMSSLISRAQHARSTSGDWQEDMEKLEQKEFEDVLDLVIGQDGSLDRIREMSTEAMERLRNAEKDKVEGELSETIANLERNVSRLRGQRNEARVARDKAEDERAEAVVARNDLWLKADKAERERFALAEKNDELEERAHKGKMAIEELEKKLQESEKKLQGSEKKLQGSEAWLKEVLEREGRCRGLRLEKEEQVDAQEAELLRLRKKMQDAQQATDEAAVASRQKHDQHVKQLQEEAQKALDDQAALHGKQVEEMRAAIDDALREKQVLSNAKSNMLRDLVDKDSMVINLRRDVETERQAKESAQKNVADRTAELDRQRQQGESAIAERDQRIEEIQRQKGEREMELEQANEELKRVNGELATKSLALTEAEGRQQRVSTANLAIQEGLARVFMAQSGYQQPELGRWLTFVQMAGQADFASCGDQLAGQDRTWTILQQWDSQTVALPAAAANTVEELLVRLYGKVGEARMDDEAVDLVRRLVVSAWTIGQVPVSLVCYVVGGCLDLIGESPDYHVVAVAFGLRQLVSIVGQRCSQDTGELEQRLGGMLSDQSTPLGALSVLLGSDNGLGLKGRIRERQEVSLPDGSVVPARYCPRQDIGVLKLPGSAGFVWALELGTHGIRRVETARLGLVNSFDWRLRAIGGGQDIILPSEDEADWDWNYEVIGGA